MAAPVGNANARKENRLWGEAIRRAVIQQDGEVLRKLAERLIAKAIEGDVQALKELGDRIDGKSAQALTVANEEGQTFTVTWKNGHG